ncbi:MAG: glycosyltransferase, partial [Candidatus Saccharimonadales bacterium]
PYPVVEGRLHRPRLRRLFVRSELQHAFKISSLILRYRPEMVVLDEILLAVFAAKRLGSRLGFVTHAPTFPRPPLGVDPNLALASALMNSLRRRAILAADVAFYVGSREHLPEARLWPWVQKHMQVVGLVSNDHRPSITRADIFKRLQLSPDRPLVVATVGALDMGRYMLAAALEAWPLVSMPEAQLMVVCGPSIDPAGLPAAPSDRVRVLGLVDDLPAYLAAADLAIVQAGLTTVSECLALGTPMICVPVKWHREQENNARYAAAMGDAGVLDRDDVTPVRLAQEVARFLGRPRPVRRSPDGDRSLTLTDGAHRTAMHINSFLQSPRPPARQALIDTVPVGLDSRRKPYEASEPRETLNAIPLKNEEQLPDSCCRR